MNITIVDYKSGNISSVINSFKEVAKDKVKIDLTSDINKIKSSDKIVLPGQGSFKSCVDGLNNINGLVDTLNEINGIHCLKPSGAFYVFPNIKETKKSSSQLASDILENAGVAVLGGSSFGKEGEGYLRLSYATSLDNLKIACERLKNHLE